MRQRLKTEVPIYRVMEGQRERDFFFTEEEAQGFINEHTQVIEKVDKASGQIVKSNPKKRNFVIAMGSRLVYKPEILKLIQTERNHEFGWTECLYFQDKLKPEIEAMIKERTQTTTPEQAEFQQKRGNILRDILSLSPEEKERLKQELGMSSTAAPAGESQLPDPELPGGADKAFVWEKRTKGALSRMTMPQLTTILEGRGFSAEGLQKAHIIYKILETDKGTPETQEQEIVT